MPHQPDHPALEGKLKVPGKSPRDIVSERMGTPRVKPLPLTRRRTAQKPSPDRSPEEIVSEQMELRRRPDMDLAARRIVEGNPDEQAENRAASRDTGLPMDAVEANPQEARNLAERQMVLGMFENSPITEQFFQVPENAALADPETLAEVAEFERIAIAELIGVTRHPMVDQVRSFFESVLGDPGRAYKRGGAVTEFGLAASRAALTGTPEAHAEMEKWKGILRDVGDEDDATYFEQAAEAMGLMIQMAGRPEMAVSVGGTAAIGALFGSAFPAVGTLAGGAIGGISGFAGQTAALMYAVEGGAAYAEMLEEGVDRQTARAMFHVVGALNSALEMTSAAVFAAPLKVFLKKNIKSMLKNPKFRKIATRMGALYGATVVTEAGTEGMQEIVTILATELAKKFTEKDLESISTEEAVARILEATEAGFGAALFLGAPGPVMSAFVQGWQVKRAKKAAAAMAKVQAGLPEGFTERAPEKAAEHAAMVLQEAGVSEVFIAADELMLYARENFIGKNIEQLAQDLGVSLTDLSEAEAMGGDVRVGGQEFAQHILAADTYDKLKDHIRYGRDEMTAAEAAEFEKLRPELTAELDLEEAAAEADQARAGVSQEQIRQKEQQQQAKAREDPVTLAEEAMGLRGLFRTADEAGMTDKQYQAHLAKIAKSRDAANRRMEELRLEDEKRANSAEFQQLADEVREEVRDSVAQRPVYEALNTIGADRLDRQEVIDALPGHPDQIKDLPRSQGQRIYTPKGQQGQSVADFASLFGHWDGANHMLTDMIRAGSFEAALEAEVTRVMEERHGDVLSEKARLERAIEAVHNREYGEVIAAEVNHMRDQLKQGRISLRLLRQAAKERMDQRLVSEVHPSKFFSAANRRGLEAGVRVRQGRLEDAARARFQQLLNFEMGRAAYAARAKVEKQKRYMEGFTKKNRKWPSIPIENLEMIRDLLAKYNFGPRASEKTRKVLLERAQKMARDRRVPFQMPERLLREEQTQHYTAMTLAEFRELHNQIKEWHHQGAEQMKFSREAEKATVADAVGQIVAGMTDNLKPRKAAEEVESRSLWQSAVRFGRDMGLSILFAENMLREMDGWVPLGPAYTFIKGGIDRAMTEGYHPGQRGYVRRKDAEAKKRKPIYEIFSKAQRVTMNTVKHQVPGTSRRMTHGARLMTMLNMSAIENREALLTKFTEEELQAIVTASTKQDRQFVQAMWDYMEEFWPEIRETTRRRRNVDPEKVTFVPIHDELTGGYFPLHYDRNLSIRNVKEHVDELVDRMMYGGFVSGHTKDGHSRDRAKNLKARRPLLLHMQVIEQHVDQVIYDLEMGDAIRDAYKVLHHPALAEEFKRQGRSDVWEKLDLWLSDIVVNELRLGGYVEGTFRYTRTGFTLSKLAWNFTTAALQGLGLLQTSVSLGKADTLRGMMIMIQEAGFGENSASAFVRNQTGFMEVRGENFHKDITDIGRMLSGSIMDLLTPGNMGEYIRLSYFYAIKRAQWFVDMATWLGAEHKGMRLFDGDHEKAKTYANSQVRLPQASGLFPDRSQWERGTIGPRVRQTEMVRAFTALISYFVAKTNVAYVRTRQTKFNNPLQVTTLVSDLILLFVVEAIASAILHGDMPEEAEDWLPFVLDETLGSLGAGVPIVRNVISGLRGFKGVSTIHYTTDMIAQTIKQMSQGEMDKALLKAANNLGGILFHYPSSQLFKTGEALAAASAGEEVEWFEFMTGLPFEEGSESPRRRR